MATAGEGVPAPGPAAQVRDEDRESGEAITVSPAASHVSEGSSESGSASEYETDQPDDPVATAALNQTTATPATTVGAPVARTRAQAQGGARPKQRQVPPSSVSGSISVITLSDIAKSLDVVLARVNRVDQRLDDMEVRAAKADLERLTHANRLDQIDVRLNNPEDNGFFAFTPANVNTRPRTFAQVPQTSVTAAMGGGVPLTSAQAQFPLGTLGGATRAPTSTPVGARAQAGVRFQDPVTTTSRRRSEIPLFTVPASPPSFAAPQNLSLPLPGVVPTAKVPARMPKDFSGESWQEWLGDFLRISQTNRWDSDTMKVQMYAACRGAAKVATKNFDLQLSSFEDLVAMLAAVFDTSSYTDRLAAFRSRIQKADEQVNAFAMDLVQKLDEVFPASWCDPSPANARVEEMKAQLALEQFISGLRFEDQRNFIFLEHPKTLQEALDAANRWNLMKIKFGTGSQEQNGEKVNALSFHNAKKSGKAAGITAKTLAPKAGSAAEKPKARKKKTKSGNSSERTGVKSENSSNPRPKNAAELSQTNLSEIVAQTTRAVLAGIRQEKTKPTASGKEKSTPTAGTSRSTIKYQTVCFVCGKPGHWMSECPRLRRKVGINSLLDLAQEEFSDTDDDQAEN